MTVPIQIPIITASPPAAITTKPAAMPEKSGSFEKILKQKTSESMQAEKGSAQPDQAVKDQPIHDAQTEEKSVKEDSKSEKINEVEPSDGEGKDKKKAETTTEQVPLDALVQAVPQTNEQAVLADVVQSSEISIAAAVVSTEASRAVISEVITSDSKTSFDVMASNKASAQGVQANLPQTGNVPSANPEANQAFEQDSAQNQLPVAPVTDPSIQQTKGNEQPGFIDQPKSAEAYKEVLGQSDLKRVSGANSAEPSDPANVLKSDPEGAAPKIKVTAPVSQEIVADVKVDTQARNIQTNTTAEGKANSKSPLIESQATIQVENSKQSSKVDSKLDAMPPAEEAEQAASPTVSPGVIQERIKTDPFTGKINEPARLAEAQTSDILRQISRQVAGSSGSQTIRIQLHPEDLGQIDLRISTSAQGTHITLVADQSSTGKLIETHIAELKQTLADAGVQMANVHVGQQSPQQSFRDAQYGQNSARHNSSYATTNGSGAEELSIGLTQSKSSLVDYRI